MLELQAAANVRDVGISEAVHELPERVGRPRRIRVREGDDLGLRLAHGVILRGDLAAARIADDAGARSLGELLGLVRGCVRRDDEPQLVVGVVERAQVCDPPLDHGCLVVSRHDDGHGRPDLGLSNTPLTDARERRDGRRIARVRPHERRECDPERDAQDHAASNSWITAR